VSCNTPDARLRVIATLYASSPIWASIPVGRPTRTTASGVLSDTETYRDPSVASTWKLLIPQTLQELWYILYVLIGTPKTLSIDTIYSSSTTTPLFVSCRVLHTDQCSKLCSLFDYFGCQVQCNDFWLWQECSSTTIASRHQPHQKAALFTVKRPYLYEFWSHDNKPRIIVILCSSATPCNLNQRNWTSRRPPNADRKFMVNWSCPRFSCTTKLPFAEKEVEENC
jgi:hypothetical protein